MPVWSNCVTVPRVGARRSLSTRSWTVPSRPAVPGTEPCPEGPRGSARFEPGQSVRLSAPLQRAHSGLLEAAGAGQTQLGFPGRCEPQVGTGARPLQVGGEGVDALVAEVGGQRIRRQRGWRFGPPLHQGRVQLVTQRLVFLYQ